MRRKERAAAASLGLPGSTVRVTGICAALKDRNGDPESFEILARSAADFQLIAKPSWWNAKHVITLFALAGCVMLGGAGLIYGQRKLIGRQEHALANSARVLRDALNNVPLLAVSLDREGCVTACNQHLLRLLGRPAEEVVGLKWRERFVVDAGPQGESRLADETYSKTLAIKHEDYLPAADGSARLVSWFNAVIHDSNGKGIGSLSLTAKTYPSGSAERRH